MWSAKANTTCSKEFTDVVQAYPLDLVRTRLAAQTTSTYYTGIWHALSTIVKDEGLFGLYRGLGATLTQVAPSLAINYCAYETLRSYWLTHEPGRQAPTVSFSFAERLALTACLPVPFHPEAYKLGMQFCCCAVSGHIHAASDQQSRAVQIHHHTHSTIFCTAQHVCQQVVLTVVWERRDQCCLIKSSSSVCLRQWRWS